MQRLWPGDKLQRTPLPSLRKVSMDGRADIDGYPRFGFRMGVYMGDCTMKATALLLFLALTACGDVSDLTGKAGGSGSALPPPVPGAQFKVTGAAKLTTSYNSPSIMVTIKNTGDTTGYNVACKVKAVNGSNTIIDTASAYFAAGGNIAPGQSAMDEAVFLNLTSHASYVTLEYECSWLIVE